MVYYLKILFQCILARKSRIKRTNTRRYLTLTFLKGSWDLHVELTQLKKIHYGKGLQASSKSCVLQLLKFSSNFDLLKTALFLEIINTQGPGCKMLSTCVSNTCVWCEDHLKSQPQKRQAPSLMQGLKLTN